MGNSSGDHGDEDGEGNHLERIVKVTDSQRAEYLALC